MRRIHSDMTKVYPGYRLWSVEVIKAFPSLHTRTSVPYLSKDHSIKSISFYLIKLWGNVAYKRRKVVSGQTSRMEPSRLYFIEYHH